MIDFFVDTYETKIRPADKQQNNNVNSNDADDGDNDDLVWKPGRPRHDRIRYLSHHPKQHRCTVFFALEAIETYPTLLADTFHGETIPKFTHSIVRVCFFS